MIASTVFLVTNVFPFARGEEFLESEIGHLAAGFDRVIVIACQPPLDARQTRTVPDNVTVLRAGQPRPRGRQAAAMVAQTMPSILRRSRSRRPVHPGHLAAEALFEARAQSSLRALLPPLDDLDLASMGPVVVYSYWFHVAARVGMLLAEELRRRGVEVSKLVSRAHRYDVYPEQSPLGHLPARRLLLEAFDEVHPVSEGGTSLLRRSYPHTAAKITTRYLGTCDPGPQVECLQDPARIVSCAFVAPVKRLDRFVGVLAQAKAGGSEIAWTHIGSGEGLEALRVQAEEALGEGLVDFRGYVPNAELPDLYREVRPLAFMSLSESEGVPVSIMEALSLGIPVVATDVGGVSEIVDDGVNGFLVPMGFTDEAVAGKVNRLVRASCENYRQFCQQARRTWERSFNEAVVYPEFVAELAGPPVRHGRPMPNVGD